jgi:hypothetical protein
MAKQKKQKKQKKIELDDELLKKTSNLDTDEDPKDPPPGGSGGR